MTASTVKSTKIANALDAVPRELQLAGKQGGVLHVAVDSIEAATTSIDEQDDVILMLPLPSQARVLSLRIYNDDLDTGGTSGAVNVGIYNGPEKFVDPTDGSFAAYAVIDADAFASAITTLTAANTAGVEIRFEAGAGTAGDHADAGKALWEVAGLDKDPDKIMVVGITVTTAMTTPAAGTITLVAQYSL